MEYTVNEFDQPVGESIENWHPPQHPKHETIEGKFCRLEPLHALQHAQSLYDSNSIELDARSWTYLPYGPFESFDAYQSWIEQTCSGIDPQFYAIVEPEHGHAIGVASYLRITPGSGSIEVGHIHFSQRLKRTPAATEAMYLMMKNAFELGYRRYEWKCDALNSPSRAAAQRLAFSFEGVFRQATVIKGRNRDTAWYAAVDKEWPLIKKAFLSWLSPSNFDEHGQQKQSLSILTAPILKMRG